MFFVPRRQLAMPIIARLYCALGSRVSSLGLVETHFAWVQLVPPSLPPSLNQDDARGNLVNPNTCDQNLQFPFIAETCILRHVLAWSGSREIILFTSV